MLRRSIALALIAAFITPVIAYEAAPKHGVDLRGSWTLDEKLSDNVEERLERRLAEERKHYARWAREMEAARPVGAPATGVEAMGPPPGAGTSERLARRRDRRDERLRSMLEVSPTLQIRQDAPRLELTSTLGARSFEAGSSTQVSMPEGQLADCNAGWDGDWFVVERRVRSGPRVVEKFRLLKKTDQLEYLMTWSGSSELSGMKIRRVFNRAPADVAPADPAFGPIR